MSNLQKIITTQDKKTLNVRFWPTDICNFSCEYCFPGSVLNKLRYPKNVDTVLKNFKILFNEYTEKHGKENFYINIVGGGEPALWPHLNYFCENIKKDHNVFIKLTTNGSRTIKWFNKNTQYIDKFTMSCHHKDVNLDKFIEVCDWIHESGKEPGVLMLMDAKHWDKCTAYVDRMVSQSKYAWTIQAKEVVDAPGHDMEVYTPEQLDYLKQPYKRIPDAKWIMDNLHDLRIHESVAMYDDDSVVLAGPNKYINNRENSFKGWKCDVALENLVVSHDGTCTGSCQEEIFKGANLNMFSESFEEEFNKAQFSLDSIICPRECCSCQPDTHITKRSTLITVQNLS
jgi:organic radical activating enzyme